MTRLHTYALMADRVYGVPDASKTLVNGWRCTARFQGEQGLKSAIYAKGEEVVVAFKGTALKTETAGEDLVADIKLGVGIIPKQAEEARNYFRIVKTKLSAYFHHMTIVGHSLGGGLAQVVGYIESTRFVTFNAPPMGGCLSNLFHGGATRAQLNRGVTGRNYRMQRDIVSKTPSRIGHVGEVVTLPCPVFKDPHKMRTVRYQLMRSAEGKKDPFAPGTGSGVVIAA